MPRRTRSAATPVADGAVHLDRDDRIALTDYLATLREAGPALEPRLLDAFDRLSPHQLDALVVLMAESARADVTPSSPTARVVGAPRRRRLSGTAQAILGGVLACLICAGGVLVAGLAFDGPGGAGPGHSTSGTTLSDLDWGQDDF